MRVLSLFFSRRPLLTSSGASAHTITDLTHPCRLCRWCLYIIGALPPDGRRMEELLDLQDANDLSDSDDDGTLAPAPPAPVRRNSGIASGIAAFDDDAHAKFNADDLESCSSFDEDDAPQRPSTSAQNSAATSLNPPAVSRRTLNPLSSTAATPATRETPAYG